MRHRRKRGDLRDLHRLAPGEWMILGGDEHEIGREDRAKLEIGRGEVHGRQDDVDLVGPQPTQSLASVRDPDVDADVGVAMPELPQVPRQHHGGGRLAGRDVEGPRRDPAVPLDERVGEPVEALHEGARELVEPCAGRGEGDARTASFEQGDRQLLLQGADLLRNGRLTREYVLGRPADALETRRVTERPELLEPIPPRMMTLLVAGHGTAARLRMLIAIPDAHILAHILGCPADQEILT